MRWSALLLAVTLASLPALARAKPATKPAAGARALPRLKLERFRLENGLEVVLHPDPRATQVVVNMLYRVGSASEPSGRSGVAHLFEHLMFMGTTRVPEKQIDVIMERAGGWNNAYTTEDITVYYDVGPGALLETMLWIEADRMATLPQAMTARKLALQRKVVLEERRQNYVDAPYGIAGLLLPGLSFVKGHPYSWPVIGSEADLRAVRVAELRAFFARHYSPKNASLVIAGGFDVARTRKLVRRYFSWIPAAEPPKPPRVAARSGVPPAAQRRREVRDRVRLPRLTLAWRSPAIYQPGDAAAELLAVILATGKRSRLHRALVIDGRQAVDVSAYQDGRRLGGQLVVEVTLRRGASRARVEKTIARVLARLVAKGPSAAELARARNRLETASVVRLQRVRHRADLINQYLAFAGRPDYLEQDLARYRRATPALLKRWAARLLAPDKRATLWVLPGGKGRSAKGAPPAKAVVAPSSRPVPTAAATTVRVPKLMDKRPPLGRLRRPKLPKVELAKLKNGIPVYLLRKHDLPLVQLRVLLRAGLAEDPPKRPGAAYLTAALLDEGAGRRDTLALAAALDELGARLQTGCSYGNSRATLRLLTRHLRRGVALLADVVRRPRFDPRAVRRVRGQLLGWARQRRADALALGDIALSASVHRGYVYGRPRLPTPGELKRLRRADLRRFHRRYYRAERAAILVSGDVRMAQLRPLLERAFGRWKARGPRVVGRRPAVLRPMSANAKKAAKTKKAAKPRPGLVLVAVPGSTQSVLRVGELAPGRRSPDLAALRLLSLVLGGSFTSRLNQNLREQHGFTYGARARFVLRQRRGLLRISTSVATKYTRRALEQILAEVRRLRRTLVSAAELAKAQRLWIEARGARSQTVGGLMSIADGLARFSLPPSSEARLSAAVLALDAKALRAAARKHLHPKRLTLVVAGALKKLRRELERRFGSAYLGGPDGL